MSNPQDDQYARDMGERAELLDQLFELVDRTRSRSGSAITSSQRPQNDSIVMPARHPGRCPVCRRAIVPGDLIYRGGPGEAWRHHRCAQG